MLRELSGSSHLDDLDRRYSALLPFTIKEVNTVRLHKAIDMPGLTFYEPLDTEDDDNSNYDGGKRNLILLTKQYHDVCPFDLNVYVFCRDDEEQRNKLRKYMLRELNWGEPMQFSAISEHLFPMVKEVCEQKGRVEYTDRILCKILMLKDEAALPPPPQSNDIQVMPLSRKHLPIVTKYWEFSKLIGPERVCKGLEIVSDAGLCYGTFLKGELVSWVTMHRYGCMAMLVTLPEHRRRGLARHCVAALCRKQLKMGLTPYLLSEDDNVASESLFRSIGFAYAGHKAQFVGYTPGQSGYEINES